MSDKGFLKRDWTDAEKWVMGIVSALAVTAILAGAARIYQSPAESAKILLANGERCIRNLQCGSKYCYPGPGDPTVEYCVDRNLQCAYPVADGYEYDDIVSFEGALYECYGPESGPANWRLIETRSN